MSNDTTISNYEIEIINKFWLILLEKIAYVINRRADQRKFGINVLELTPFTIETDNDFKFKRDERNKVFGFSESKNLKLWHLFNNRGFFKLNSSLITNNRLPYYKLNAVPFADIFKQAEDLFPDIEKVHPLRKEKEKYLVTKLLDKNPCPFNLLKDHLKGSPITSH